MVQSGSKFLETQKRLMAAAKNTNIPGATEVEEKVTQDISPEEEKKSRTQREEETITQSKEGQKLIGDTNAIGKRELSEGGKEKVSNLAQKIIDSKIGKGLISAAEYIPQTKLAQMITEAQTAESAEDIKQRTQEAIEGVETTEEAREILYGESPEFKKKYGWLRGAAKIADTWMFRWTPGAKKFIQSRNDLEKNIYLSNGTTVIKEPELDIPNGLDNAKNLAASITYAYITQGKIVDASTIKEKMDGFDDVPDGTLNKFIGGILDAYINKKDINWDYVAEKYGDIVKSDNYLSKKQATIDLLMNPETRAYGLDQNLNDAIEADPELLKVIQAYTAIGQYGEFLSTNGYNKYGSTDRGLAQSYQDEGFEVDGGMSLKEAYTIASQYKGDKLDNLLKALTNNLQKTEKYATREYSRVTKRPREQNTVKFISDIGSVSKTLLHDFAEFNVEGWSESGLAKYTPLGIADLFVSGRTFTDGEGNVRNRNGKVVFLRQADGTYINSKGENVTKMLRTQQGFLKSFGNHLEGLTSGVAEALEGSSKMSSVREDEGFAKSLEYTLPIFAGLFDTYFNGSMLMSPKILALESTPLTSEGMGLFFGGLSELGVSLTEGALEVLNLADAMDPENVEAAKNLGSTALTIGVMGVIGKKIDPYKKTFLEAKEKVFNKYWDKIVQITGREELNGKIKKEKLPDKAKEETIIDGEKTVAEIKREKVEGKTEAKQEVVKKTPAEKIEIKEPTQREVIDITPTKDKLGYAIQVNRAVISDMVREFKQEFKKSMNKNLPEGSVGRALYDMSESDVSFKEQAQKTFKDIGLTSKDFVNNITEGLRKIRDSAKSLPKEVGEKITTKRANKAYDNMRMSDNEVNTIRNNPLTSKLGALLHNLIGTRRGKVQPKTNMEKGERAKYMKDSIARDRVKEQLKAGVERLKERRKTIHDNFYQKLSSIKNIDFSGFFLGKNGILKSLKEVFKGDNDSGTYARFRMVDGKIVMEYKKGHSTYYDDYVRPKLEELVKEYNDMLENGKISEQNISKINDIIQKITNQGKAMQKNENPEIRKEGFSVEKAGESINRAFNEYLKETGVANKLLVGKKAYEAINKMEKMFEDIMTDGKIDESKAAKFLEKLTDEQIADLESLGIKTSDYIDLMNNGVSAANKIFDFQMSLKEMKSVLGDLSRGVDNKLGRGLGKFGTLLAVLFKGSEAVQWLAGIGLAGMAIAPGFKGLGKLADKIFQRNLKKALNKELNPRDRQQLQDMLEEMHKTVNEIDSRLNKVIEQWTQSDKTTKPTEKKTETAEATEEQGPNRKKHDTSHPNREEYDPNAPIFRNGEDKQQPVEQRDNDMVVSEQESLPGQQNPRLTDERKYLEHKEDPEEEFNQAMEDLGVEIKILLKNLRDMLDNDDDGGDGGDGGNGEKPIKPKDPDTQDVIDTIDSFIAEMENTTPKQGEDRPSFKLWSNESLNKLFDTNGNLKEGVPSVYEEEIRNELMSRALKDDLRSDSIENQNNIIRSILKEEDKVRDGKRKDIESSEFSEDIMQARGVDQFKAAEIFDDIVEGRITEIDIRQKKTTYEDNEEASKWIEKRTGKKTKTTKSASKTSSLEVWDTKPDSQGKLNALKTQLAAKKKALPKTKSYETLKKRQEEIDKLEKEIARLEEKLNAKELDDFDLADKEAVDNIIAESEKESKLKEVEIEEASEGDVSTIFEDMELRELLESDDVSATDEIKARKEDLVLNPKRTYKEIKELLEDDNVTSKEAEFYDDVVKKTRTRTDMTEEQENKLIEMRDKLWEKTHDGLLFSKEDTVHQDVNRMDHKGMRDLFEKSVRMIVNENKGYTDTPFAKKYVYQSSGKRIRGNGKEVDSMIDTMNTLLDRIGVKWKFGKTKKGIGGFYNPKTHTITIKNGTKYLTIYGHEPFHAFMDFIKNGKFNGLAKEEITKIQDLRKEILEEAKIRLRINDSKFKRRADMFAEEWLANAFSEYLGKRQISGPKKLVMKVENFFQQIRSILIKILTLGKKSGINLQERKLTNNMKELFDNIIEGKIQGEFGNYNKFVQHKL